MKENISFTKKTKRIIALALVLVLCLAMVPIATFASTTEDEYSTCPYCGEVLSGNWTFTKVAGELECDNEEHISQSECEACAEYARLMDRVCTEEVDSIITFNNDGTITSEEQEHIHGVYCYVECTDPNCNHDHDYTCVVPCTINHQGHNEDCYTSSYCVHTEITTDDIVPLAGTEPNANYYNSANYLLWTFDYKATSGSQPSSSSVTVKTNEKTVTYDTGTLTSSSTTTGDAITKGIINVSVPVGYRLATYRIVCGDKSGCQTAASGNEAKGSFDTTGDYTSTVAISVARVDFGHSNQKSPYVLLLTFVKVEDTYKVEYDLGAITGIDFSSAVVPDASTGLAYNYQYNVKGITETASAAAAAVDYEFAGWKAETTATYNGSIFNYNQSFAIQANTKLIAQWKPIDRTVTYEWSGLPGATAGLPVLPPESTQHYNDTVSVDGTYYNAYSFHTNTLTGYTGVPGMYVFSGWSVESPEGLNISTSFTMPKSNVVLEGAWSFQSDATYTVTYEFSDKGDGSPSDAVVPVDPNSPYYIGRTVTLLSSALSSSSTTKGALEGSWSFSGWYTDAGCTTAASNFEITQNTTLYGYWEFTEKSKATVTYEFSNLGDGSPSDAVVPVDPNSPYYIGKPVTLLSSALSSSSTTNGTLEGSWSFSGWYTDAGCTTAASDFTIAQDTTLYGTWTFVPVYTVTYVWDSNSKPSDEELEDIFGTSSPPSEATIAEGTTNVAVDSTYNTSTTVDGIHNGFNGTWTFEGWVPVDPDDLEVAVDKTFTMPSQDVTFKGAWKFDKDADYLDIVKRFNGIGEVPAGFTISVKYDNASGTPVKDNHIIAQGDSTEGAGYIEYKWTFELPAGAAFTVEESNYLVAGYNWSSTASLNNSELTVDVSTWSVEAEQLIEESNTFYIENTYATYSVSYSLVGEIPGDFDQSNIPVTTNYPGGEQDIAVANNLDDFEAYIGETLIARYTFKGWVPVEPVDLEITDGIFEMPNADVVFEGSWSKESYDLVVAGYSGYYDGLAHNVTVTTELGEGYIRLFSLTGNDGEWVTRVALADFVNVTRNAAGTNVPITVFVKDENEEAKSVRYGSATVYIQPITIVLNAGSNWYNYNGQTRYIDTYSTIMTRGTTSISSLPNGEYLTAYAYGAGAGARYSDVRYDVLFYTGANGTGSVVTNANAVTIYYADGSVAPTSNYSVSTNPGTLTIYGGTRTTTTTTPTRTTTTTTPATTATVSLADPPAYQTIGDTTTPLAQMPVSDTPINIADESVPLGPVTGDVSPIALLICLLVISGAAIVIVGKKRFGKSN